MIESERFAQEYQANGIKVQRFLARRGLSWDLAEEISQKAWTRAWEKRGQFREETALTSWVCGIAFNFVREHFRDKRNQNVPLDGHTGSYSEHFDGAIDARSFLARCQKKDVNLLRRGYLEARSTPLSGSMRFQLHRAKLRIRRMIQ